jgi:hypothetical protein
MRGMETMERDEVGELVREFLEEYLPHKRKERMGGYKKKPALSASEESDTPLNEGDGPDQPLPPECLEGRCEHPEHASDDDLDDL